MRKAALIAAAALVLLVVLIAGVGYLLPVDHTASGSTLVAQPPERVHEMLANVQGYPSWRSDVKSVELLSASPTRWREQGTNDEVTFEIVESRPPTRLVIRIADESLPFGGTWTFVLQGDPGGTRVTITEDGKVFNPVFRFLSRFVFGHTATIDRYLTDLRSAAAGQSRLNTRTQTDATRSKIRVTRSNTSPSLMARAT